MYVDVLLCVTGLSQRFIRPKATHDDGTGKPRAMAQRRAIDREIAVCEHIAEVDCFGGRTPVERRDPAKLRIFETGFMLKGTIVETGVVVETGATEICPAGKFCRLKPTETTQGASVEYDVSLKPRAAEIEATQDQAGKIDGVANQAVGEVAPIAEGRSLREPDLDV